MEEKIIFANDEETINILGRNDENLRLIRNDFPKAKIIVRGNELLIKGENNDVSLIKKLLEDLLSILHSGHIVNIAEIKYSLKMLHQNKGINIGSIFEDAIYVSDRGKPIRPKTLGQRRYVEAIQKHDIIFGIGPAGVGKTYLSVAMAVSNLMNKEVARIILTRPAIEAGEKLGFLPGDMMEKVDPYLRPLYDAIFDMIGVEKFHYLLNEGVIEVAPLAFMRGRTLNDSFVILDEAQNTTHEQMKMFLTRLGFDSKAVITGDITQIDLPATTISGLVEVQTILSKIEGISFVYFDSTDVVRHRLVSDVIKAYEEHEDAKRKL